MPRPTSSFAAAPFRIAAIFCVLWMYAGILSSGQKQVEQSDQAASPTPVAESVPAAELVSATEQTPAAESPSREVFLWYVNETSPNEAERKNYDTILEWLESGSPDKTGRYIQELRDELTLFPAAVEREQSAIEAGTLAVGGKLDTMIVTNRLARAGKYRYYDAAKQQFVEGELAIPPSADYVLASNPLVRGEVLKLVLAEAARRYDPTQHRFVLITKSHAGPDRALTVRLSRHSEQMTREILLASLDGDPEELPSLVQCGVTKNDFFTALDNAGEGKMQFPLVFLEACRGAISRGKEQSPPENVGLLYASGNRGLQYSTLDYEALLKQVAAGEKFTAVLDQFLKPRYPAFVRPETAAWKKLLWFAPLALLLLFFGYVKWRQPRMNSGKAKVVAADPQSSIAEPAHPSLDAETPVGANPAH